MKKSILILVAVVVIGGAYVLYDRALRIDSVEVGSQLTTYRNENIGLEFMYRGGVDGYVVTEEEGDGAVLQRSIVLMSARDKAELDASTSPREGPPTITIQAYRNSGKQSAAVWAMEHLRESNAALKIGSEVETIVGGANGIRYTRDGLYTGDVVIVAHGSYVYIMDGSYAENESPIQQDFADILASVKFIPELGQE